MYTKNLAKMLHNFEISWNSFATNLFLFKKFKNNTINLLRLNWTSFYVGTQVLHREHSFLALERTIDECSIETKRCLL